MTRLLIVHFVEFHPFQIGRCYSASAIREAILLPPRRLAPAYARSPPPRALRHRSSFLRPGPATRRRPAPHPPSRSHPFVVLFPLPNARNMLAHHYLENYFVFTSWPLVDYSPGPRPRPPPALIRSHFRIKYKARTIFHRA